MASTRNDRKLFTPLRVGDMELSHRIVMSPLTRGRAPNGLPTKLNAEYYSQRATPGGLLISEGTFPSVLAGNFHDIPRIFTTEHIQAWRVVTEAVHAKGGFIFCQLWHAGRVAVSAQIGQQPLSSSATNLGLVNRFTDPAIGPVQSEVAKEMTEEEIEVTRQEYVHAAKCAIEAGFDGVEIPGGNGFLFDQFINDGTNFRKDAFGGVVENRARFVLRVLDSVSAAIGASRTAVRFSPWGTTLMPLDSHPLRTYSYILDQVDQRRLAYVCLTQPRSDLFLPEGQKLSNILEAVNNGKVIATAEDVSIIPLLKYLKQTVKFVNGGYNSNNCFEEVEADIADGVVFAKPFISNPDLVDRIKHGYPLAPVKREHFYGASAAGYTDHPVWQVDEKRLVVVQDDQISPVVAVGFS